MSSFDATAALLRTDEFVRNFLQHFPDLPYDRRLWWERQIAPWRMTARAAEKPGESAWAWARLFRLRTVIEAECHRALAALPDPIPREDLDLDLDLDFVLIEGRHFGYDSVGVRREVVPIDPTVDPEVSP